MVNVHLKKFKGASATNTKPRLDLEKSRSPLNFFKFKKHTSIIMEKPLISPQVHLLTQLKKENLIDSKATKTKVGGDETRTNSQKESPEKISTATPVNQILTNGTYCEEVKS